MAMLDDPDWLLRHIRHSFITSDDTGMCEMVLQENDRMTLDQHKQRIKQLKEEKRIERAKKSQRKGLPDSFGRSTPITSPKRAFSDSSSVSSETPTIDSEDSRDVAPLAPSPDIQSGWDFGGRRRSNTAQKLERIRKDRQNRVKVNSIPWRKKEDIITQDEFGSMFQKKDLSSSKYKNPNEINGEDITFEKTVEREKTVLPNALNTSLPTSVTISDHVTKHLGFDNGQDTSSPVAKLESEDNTSNSTLEGFTTNRKDSSTSPSSNSSVNELTVRTRGVSLLSKLLTESTEQYDNPFREYSKFDGHGQSAPGIRKINIYVWPFGAEKPKYPVLVSVLTHKAKVHDVIGLTCWKYSLENNEPSLTGKTVQRFALHIAEDDGTVDEDFPSLEANEPFSKFKFNTLAMVEKRPTQNDDDKHEGFKQTICVRVNDHEGSSMVKVEDLSIKMGEILRRTLARRKGRNYTGKYVLEYQDRVGEAVNEEQSLESTGVMEFYLVREHSSRGRLQTIALDPELPSFKGEATSPGSDVYKFPPVEHTPSPANTTPAISDGFIFVPATEYVVFHLNLVRKVRSSVPVEFGVGLHQIDVVPVERRENRIANLLSPRVKTLTIRVGMLAYCGVHDPKTRTSSLSVTPPSSSGSFSSSMSSFAYQESISSSKSYERTVFKLYYKLSNDHTDYKHLTLEGPSDDVTDAIEKVNKVMVLSGNRKLQSAFEAHKFGIASSTTSSSHSTLKRRGSLFR